MGTVGIDIADVVASSETYEKADDVTLKVNLIESDLVTLDMLKFNKQTLESKIKAIDNNRSKVLNELNLVNKRIAGAEALGVKDTPVLPSPPVIIKS